MKMGRGERVKTTERMPRRGSESTPARARTIPEREIPLDERRTGTSERLDPSEVTIRERTIPKNEPANPECVHSRKRKRLWLSE